ncbi:TonB-dependent receptor [Chitinimonas lacunae]|uniref:TonB-dependent receptor n=1 Tax=Chitinimonas lacunae TaxID=1963018 RepID=A0ABV8MLV4_9NEIS
MYFRKTHIAALIAGLASTVWAADSVSVGEIKVQGTGAFGGGKMIQEETAKARSSVGKKAIEEKPATANPYQLISQMPGVNASSQDATGLFGGTLTIRGFSASQMGFTIDGAPVNDSGSYDVFPQEYSDAENLEEVFVTQGTTDNDAPHVGATGGNVGMVSQNPLDRFRVKFSQTVGDDHMFKTFVRLDTGKTGPVKSFLSVSKAESDKWRGVGQADRTHVTAKSVWNIGGGHSVSAGVDYNKAVNHFLRRTSKQNYQTFGRFYDYDGTFGGRRVTAGRADSESGLTNYYDLNKNPFENALFTGKATVALGANMSFNLEPYFWYGFGGGANGNTLREADFTTGGRDLNGDGDRLDTVAFYRISKTVTHRPGVTARLNWQLNDHKLRLGLWWERARHRQTQPYVFIDDNGRPMDDWADGSVVLRNDGQIYQNRNWRTITTATQFFAEDAFSLGDKWSFLVGVRTPKTEREGYDYGSGSETQAQYREVSRSWDQILPNASAKFQIDQQSHLFAAVSKNFRAPQNFVLFERNPDGSARDINPERSINIDLGYRFQGELFNFSGSLFSVDFKDRQASRQDEDGTRRNYNVGDVEVRGLELEMASRPINGLSGYGSLTLTRSKQLDNFKTQGANRQLVELPTSGKQMVDTPRLLASAGVTYQLGGFSTSLSAKYTGKRYGDLTNDESISSATVYDLSAGYRFKDTAWFRNASVRLSVQNLFDKNYLAGIPSTSTNAVAYGGVAAFSPNYDIGNARFTSVVFSADF